MKQQPIIDRRGPFTRNDLLNLQNEVIDRFNAGKLKTYLIRVVRKNSQGKLIYKDSWVDFQWRKPEGVVAVFVYEYKQQATFIN